ncbi:MAG: RNA 2',3'-cyclic phosphodiesterase [Chitinophagales bacterium]|nr:RNA 2',3'-cyclic phosphodiesterase [Chitinophagales bacterium]
MIQTKHWYFSERQSKNFNYFTFILLQLQDSLKRIFFTIPIPEAISTALLKPFIGRHVYGVRWVPQEQLHITVYFAGEVTEEVLHTFDSLVPVLCQSKTAFNLEFENLRLLYKNKKPAMLWAVFKEHSSFTDLSVSICRIFSAPERREQTPHITLARIRQLHQLPFDLPAMKPFSIHVDSIELWQSHLQQTGSVYEVISQWKLGK